MKKSKLFLNLLREEKIQEEIKDLYCELHKNFWNDGYVKRDIILSKDGTVDYIAYIGNQTRMDVHNGDSIVIITIDEYSDVSDEDLGELEEVWNYDEYIEWLHDEAINKYHAETEEEIQGHIEDYCDDWQRYSEFDSTTYEKYRLEAWEFMCEQYDLEVIEDNIYRVMENLKDKGEEYFK